MERPTGHNQSGGGRSPDEWARRLTIVLGAPLALIVSALALFQFL
jgi:hypothetical protein